MSWIKRMFRREGDSLMNKIGKILIVIVLIAAVVVVIAVKQNRYGQNVVVSIDAVAPGNAAAKPSQLIGGGLPSLIDIGAGTCIPCKMMAPILEELKKELAGKIIVQFLDLNKNPKLAQQYHISVMPTQIFYDALGKEIFRHEGFYSKEDILAKWKELGIELAKTE